MVPRTESDVGADPGADAGGGSVLGAPGDGRGGAVPGVVDEGGGGVTDGVVEGFVDGLVEDGALGRPGDVGPVRDAPFRGGATGAAVSGAVAPLAGGFVGRKLAGNSKGPDSSSCRSRNF